MQGLGLHRAAAAHCGCGKGSRLRPAALPTLGTPSSRSPKASLFSKVPGRCHPGWACFSGLNGPFDPSPLSSLSPGRYDGLTAGQDPGRLPAQDPECKGGPGGSIFLQWAERREDLGPP